VAVIHRVVVRVPEGDAHALRNAADDRVVVAGGELDLEGVGARGHQPVAGVQHPHGGDDVLARLRAAGAERHVELRAGQVGVHRQIQGLHGVVVVAHQLDGDVGGSLFVDGLGGCVLGGGGTVVVNDDIFG